MQTDRLEPAGACKGPCNHGDRAEAPTVPLRPLVNGELVLVSVPATILTTDRDGRVFVEVASRDGIRNPVRLWVGRPEVEAP
jgi:hypothetical protein